MSGDGRLCERHPGRKRARFCVTKLHLRNLSSQSANSDQLSFCNACRQLLPSCYFGRVAPPLWWGRSDGFLKRHGGDVSILTTLLWSVAHCEQDGLSLFIAVQKLRFVDGGEVCVQRRLPLPSYFYRVFFFSFPFNSDPNLNTRPQHLSKTIPG